MPGKQSILNRIRGHYQALQEAEAEAQIYHQRYLAELDAEYERETTAARQSFLRAQADNPKQPRYVRGWVRQEINRIEQGKRAVAEGRQPPGGPARQIRGIPGLDVGHRFPDLDLPENFRLEDRATNRRRPIIARRLGIDHLYR